MVISYYLLKPFYSAWWRLLNQFSPRRETVFYCHTPVDMQNWLPVQQHLKPLRIVTDKAGTYRWLRAKGYAVSRLPVFPKAVIMCREAAHKFPSAKVMKLGMTHGAYHFKRFTSAKHYAPFTLYLFTSEADLRNARAIGVSCGKAGGYPKLDPYLHAPIPSRDAKTKPRLLFTATYDSGGMSAVERWIDHLPALTTRYEVFVSLHPWISAQYIAKVKSMPQVHYIADSPLPYIAQADLVVVDTSSIIADCCAFDKPLISWTLPPSPRSVPQITEILERISIRVKSIDELEAAILRALAQPDEFKEQRAWANSIFFDALDGNAGKRSADHILNLLPELKP
jgi:hypothetical protein